MTTQNFKFGTTLALATTLFFTSLSSCHIDDNTQPEYDAKVDAEQVNALFAKNATPTETFTITAEAGGTVTTSKGSKFTFAANSLQDESGNTITGAVKIRVKEVGTTADMILSDRPTATNDGKMLVSLGEFKIDAEQGAKRLRLRGDNRVQGQAAAPPRQPNGQGFKEFPMWGGDTTITTSTNGLNPEAQNVTIFNTFSVKKGVDWTQISGQFGGNDGTNINFPIDALGQWRNCDVLYSDPRPKTTLMCYFATNFNTAVGNSYSGADVAGVFFKPKNTNTLIKLYNVILQPTAGKEGFYSYKDAMPVGMEGTFLVYSVINGQYYAEIQENITIATPASGKQYSSVTFNPIAVSEATFLTMIQSMNSK